MHITKSQITHFIIRVCVLFEYIYFEVIRKSSIVTRLKLEMLGKIFRFFLVIFKSLRVVCLWVTHILKLFMGRAVPTYSPVSVCLRYCVEVRPNGVWLYAPTERVFSTRKIQRTFSQKETYVFSCCFVSALYRILKMFCPCSDNTRNEYDLHSLVRDFHLCTQMAPTIKFPLIEAVSAQKSRIFTTLMSMSLLINRFLPIQFRFEIEKTEQLPFLDIIDVGNNTNKLGFDNIHIPNYSPNSGQHCSNSPGF